MCEHFPKKHPGFLNFNAYVPGTVNTGKINKLILKSTDYRFSFDGTVKF